MTPEIPDHSKASPLERAQAQYRIGLSLLQRQQCSQAAIHFETALYLDPGSAPIWNDLGRALVGESKHERAKHCFEQALACAPDLAEAHNNLGCALRRERDLDGAARHLQRALELKSNFSAALKNLGHVYQDQGLTDEAVAVHRRAISLEPSNAEHWNSLGAAYFRAADLVEALAAYGEAIRLNPNHVDARISRGMLRLRQGNFREGWQDYEWRFQGNKYPYRKFSTPAWDGSPLTGRSLLVHAEQGFGDTLQFVRFLPQLRTYGGTVFCEVQPELLPLLRQSDVPNLLGRKAVVPKCDFQIPLLSLPRILGTTLETIPAQVPYLAADPKLVDQWRQCLGPIDGFKVGIAWQGKQSYEGDRERSIPLAEFAPLAALPIHLVSLQKHVGTDQLMAIGGRLKVLTWGEHLDGAVGAFMDTAAIMRNLDLVITSDTAIAHLAGGLGVPVWVALPARPDWRWMDDREDSPWYPTMRLFRQTERGNWGAVFQNMTEALSGKLTLHSGNTPGAPGAANDDRPRVVPSDSESAGALHRQGLKLQSQTRFAEAIVCFQKALAAQPNEPDILNDLGCAYWQTEQLNRAVDCFRSSLEQRPDFSPAHNNLGCALRKLERIDEAIVAYHRAIELKPDLADAYNNLGCALRKKEQKDSAIDAFRKAIELKPDFADAHSNLAGALIEDRPEEAVVAYQKALEVKPDQIEARAGLGCVLQAIGREEEAAACYRQVIDQRPEHAEAHLNNGFLLLAQGNLAAGWEEYEWRLKSKVCEIQTFNQPLWDGYPLNGRTLLVHAEQGLGDCLQFVRYLPLLEKLGGVVHLEVLAPLVPLLAQSGVKRLIARGKPLPPFDVHVPLLSLPRICRTDLATIPNHVPYLLAHPQLVDRWAQKLSAWQGFKVGMVWQGNRENKGDRKRSVPVAHFAPLARLEGVRLFSLQKGIEAGQLAAAPFEIHDFGPEIDRESGPFMDTAAILKNLDLLLACDTAVAHLAGALGVPTWLALQRLPDWRWMLDRDDTPWYPSMRLFRQQEFGDWGPVFERMADELQQLLARNANASGVLSVGSRSL